MIAESELIENKVDILKDLTSITGPVLSIRDTEYVIPYGGKLVLNYHVYPYYGPEYPNGDGTVTVGKPSGDTFTFVARIDEDTLDLDQVPEYKQTTYQGEQTMEIDCSELDAGPHSALVQVISSGLSSPCIWLKFRIKDENEESDLASHTVDLNETENAYFESEYVDLGDSYIDFNTGDEVLKPKNCSRKYVRTTEYIQFTTSGTKHLITERVIVAGYTVTVKSPHEIEIVVSNGRIYYTFINSWNAYYRRFINAGGSYVYWPDAYESASVYTRKVEDISGTYTLTDRITVGGTEYLLKDYLDVPMEDIPASVRNSAIANKIALTRLLEAIQAKFYGNGDIAGKHKVILPQGMDIVVDYHGFNAMEDGNGNIKLNHNSVSSKEEQRNWSHIRFPDRLTLDLNGSTISAFCNSDINSGEFLNISDCYDTHIINGKVRGTYKGKNYDGEGDAESLSNIAIQGSEFCSFEDIDCYYSTGYDAECIGRGGLKVYSENRKNPQYVTNRIQFNQPGYIDLDGKKHPINSAQQYDTATGELIDTPVTKDMIFPRYTEGVDTGTTNKKYAQNSLLHKFVMDGGVPLYRGRKPFRSGVELMHGGHAAIARGSAGDMSGDDALFGPGSIYIYFYKPFDPDSQVYQDWLADKAAHEGEEGYEPDFEPLEFIKAYKVRMHEPLCCPKGAMYAHMCALGTFTVHGFHGLKDSDSDDSLGRPHLYEYQASFASGYKRCNFIYARTSIMNWHYSHQCYMRNSYTYCLASGRPRNQGGMSSQTYNIDTEDVSWACSRPSFDGLECISGGNSARFHHPVDVCFDGLRNYSMIVEKNVFMGVVRNCFANVKNKLGYSHPVKFTRFVNNIFTELSTSISESRGCASGKMLVENCFVSSESSSGNTEITKKVYIITGELNS